MIKNIIKINLSVLLISTNIFAGADAGIKQEVLSGQQVQLNASGSILERDGKFIRFNWRQTNGKLINLFNRHAVQSSFIAPNVTESTILTFKLNTKERYNCNKRRCKIFRSSDFVDVIIIPKKEFLPTELENPAQINFKGFKYLPITSPTTGKVWLDRNLGAREVCNTLNNVSCFGDLYQWGRDSDGHQVRTSPISYGASNELYLTNNSFFTSTEDASYFYIGDWTTKDSDGNIRSANWSKINGSSICPSDYRVPTIDELSNELSNTIVNNNYIKLAYAGFRDDYFGNLINIEHANLWSSTTIFPSDFASAFIVTSDQKKQTRVNNITPRTSGYSIRCIKN